MSQAKTPSATVPGDREPDPTRAKRRPGRPPGRTKVGASETRVALLSSALELFARHGFDGVSVAQIADAAGTTPSLLHYYFGSKREIWEEALGAVFSELTEEFTLLDGESSQLDPLIALEKVIRRFVAYSVRHPQVSLLLRSSHSSSGEQMAWLRTHYLLPQRALPVRLIVELQRQGRLRAGAPDHILQVIIGACTLPLRGRPSLGELYDLEEDPRQAGRIHADLVVTMVLEGLVIAPADH